MSYNLFWRSPALPYTQKQTPIAVPAGSVVSNAASLRFTGKGATNYGKIQQENLLRLLENFAGPTAPDNPTVGQTWYDTTEGVLKVCTSTIPVSPAPIWYQLNATQVSTTPPLDPTIGDTWFDPTGSASGVLYLYTGVGRYPQIDWDATTPMQTGWSTYYPPVSTTGAININVGNAIGSPSGGEAYINAIGSSTDATWTILRDGVTVVAPFGLVYTEFPVTDGLIVWDTAGTMVGNNGSPVYFVVHQTQSGRFFYDNNSALVEVPVSTNMFVVGRITVAARDDALQSNTIVSAEIWTEAPRLRRYTQAASSLTAGAIGGWEQVWPNVETFGGRFEYDYLYDQLASIIGHPMMYGGSGAEGRAIQNLTDFKTLDASMQIAWQNLIPTDPNVTRASFLTDLHVDPNSQDWDKLLSACRYALNRLELPSGFVNDLATMPFVQDGLPGDPSVVSATGVRALPNQRYHRTKNSAITAFSQYQETVNVMRAAVENRYLAKGILEGSGVNTDLSTVSRTVHTTVVDNPATWTGTTTRGLVFRFDGSVLTGNNGTSMNMEQFFYSGGAIDVVVQHNGNSSAADIELAGITSSAGRFRLTGSNSFVMEPSAYTGTTSGPEITQAPTNLGFVNLTASALTLATVVNGGTTLRWRASDSAAAQTVTVIFEVLRTPAVTPGTFSSNFVIEWAFIHDGETYLAPAVTNVYPAPLPVDPVDYIP
jgi:hypothetical protein